MTERRYGDEEIREIFKLATTDVGRDRRPASESGGLTLEELQHVGKEAGIDAASVARAAAALDARGTPTPIRRSFGLPVGLTRVVELPRAPTDREWEQLIAEFRTTFGVQGDATSSGSMRQWSHGNLHISLEPTARGEQLRISTLNDAVVVLNGLGVVFGVMSLLMGAVVTAAGKPEKALIVVGLFGGLALAAIGSNLIRAPRWARERERQVEALAEHVVKFLTAP